MRSGFLIISVLCINDVEIGCVPWLLKLWSTFHSRGPSLQNLLHRSELSTFPISSQLSWSCILFPATGQPLPIRDKGTWPQNPSSVSQNAMALSLGLWMELCFETELFYPYSSNLEWLFSPPLAMALSSDPLPFSSVVWYCA